MNVESDRMFFLKMMVRAGFSAHYHGDNIAVFTPTGIEPINEPSVPEEYANCLKSGCYGDDHMIWCRFNRNG